MKKILLGLVILFSVQLSFGQLIKPIPKPSSWLKPIPKPSTLKLDSVYVPIIKKPVTTTMWRPVGTLPVLRYQNNQFSTVSLGGGIAWEYLQFNDSTGRWSSVVSLSPLTILTGVNINGSTVSLSYAATAGFFNNLLLVGYGYDITQKQPFFLISVGVNFNN
jgi:hypothetical protein